ncbi:MAG: hypothetical protein ACOVNQ_08080, partial [Pirellula sp.]
GKTTWALRMSVEPCAVRVTMGIDSPKNRGWSGEIHGEARSPTRTRNEALGLQGFEYEYEYRVAEYEISKQ